ncbi:hypothetical protein H0H93_006129 [Arthromyces matolae]|nr:hypothetical protein H0H93_006129 [Arthromyces matolae]
MAYWGRFNASNPATLPVGRAFQPAGDREWLVKFWQLDGKWVGIALPFGIVLWILFFFDHNVSSLMAQSSEFPLRKPPGFHWDFFLLGVTTFIAGLLGLPAPNGLIPQAPIHTTSLLVMGYPPKMKQEDIAEDATINESGVQTPLPLVDSEKTTRSRISQHSIDRMIPEVPVSVVEQRLSNLAQGSLCLVLLTGPFLHVLNLIPKGVLAGLFWYMGVDALRGNGITRKLFYFLRDRNLTPELEPLRKVRKSRILLFVTVQLVGFGATFAITQTVAAIGFPVIIMLLIPIRVLLIPRLPFTADELAILDQPTASPFGSTEPIKRGAWNAFWDASSGRSSTFVGTNTMSDSDSKVLGVVLLIRHGDRQGFYQSPTTYTASNTILTPLGNQQEYQLGQQLRSLYLNSSSPEFINGMNTTLVNYAQFHVRADAGGEAGVIMNSAQSLLQGLIPADSNFTTTLANGTTIEAPLGGYQA